MFKHENKLTLGAPAILAILSAGFLIAGIAVIVKWATEYFLTGMACVAFAVFLFSILMLTGSFSRPENPYHQSAPPQNWWIVFAISLVAVVLLGLLAKSTEFGT